MAYFHSANERCHSQLVVSTENLLPQPMREQMLSEKLGCYHGDGLYYHHHNGEDGYAEGTGSGCCWVYFTATQHVVFIFMNSSPAIAASPELVAQAYYASGDRSRTGDPVGDTLARTTSAPSFIVQTTVVSTSFILRRRGESGRPLRGRLAIGCGPCFGAARADGIDAVVFRSASTDQIHRARVD